MAVVLSIIVCFDKGFDKPWEASRVSNEPSI